MTLFPPSAGLNGRSRLIARWMVLSCGRRADSAPRRTGPAAGQARRAKGPPASRARRGPRRRLQARDRHRRPRRDLSNQGRGAVQLQGDEHLELPDRRPRPAPHQLARACARRPNGRRRSSPNGDCRTSTSRPGARSDAAGPTNASTRRWSSRRRFPLLAFPKAWTPGTNGPVTAEAVMVSIEKEEDFAKYQGKLARQARDGLAAPRIQVLLRVADAPLHRQGARRHVEAARRGGGGRRFGPGGPGGFGDAATAFRRKRMEFYVKEGVAAVLEMSPGDRGDNGAVRVQAFAQGEGSREVNGPTVVPQVVLSARTLRPAGAPDRQEDSGQDRARHQEQVRRHRPQQLQRRSPNFPARTRRTKS